MRLALSVADRYATAAAVDAALRRRGWTLYELHHDLPSLERVFLHLTGSPGTADGADGDREEAR